MQTSYHLEKTWEVEIAYNTKLLQNNPLYVLGMVMQSGLTWLSHINYIIRKVNSGIFLIRKLNRIESTNVLPFCMWGFAFLFNIWNYSLGKCIPLQFLIFCSKPKFRAVFKSSSIKALLTMRTSSITFPSKYLIFFNVCNLLTRVHLFLNFILIFIVKTLGIITTS